MADVVQLIINGTPYPITSHDKYRAYPQDLGKTAEMISGRKVKEIRGRKWIIEYNYDYFDDAMLRACLAALRSDELLLVDFLVPESEGRQTANFLCTKEPAPYFAFATDGKGYWHNIGFMLEESDSWR